MLEEEGIAHQPHHIDVLNLILVGSKKVGIVGKAWFPSRLSLTDRMWLNRLAMMKYHGLEPT